MRVLNMTFDFIRIVFVRTVEAGICYLDTFYGLSVNKPVFEVVMKTQLENYKHVGRAKKWSQRKLTPDIFFILEGVGQIMQYQNYIPGFAGMELTLMSRIQIYFPSRFSKTDI